MKTTTEIVKEMTWKEFRAELVRDDFYADDCWNRWRFVPGDNLGFMTIAEARNFWRSVKRSSV